jgi:hypothetical protein
MVCELAGQGLAECAAILEMWRLSPDYWAIQTEMDIYGDEGSLSRPISHHLAEIVCFLRFPSIMW